MVLTWNQHFLRFCWKLPSLQSRSDATTNTGFLHTQYLEKEANFSKKLYRLTLFNTLTQNYMQNLECFWWSSLLSKIPEAIFPPKPSTCLLECLHNYAVFSDIHVFKLSTVGVMTQELQSLFLVKERNQSVCPLCNNAVIKKSKINIPQ